MANLPEENGEGSSDPSPKRQRLSPSADPLQNQENENENQETQNQENENLETQQQEENENQETHQEEENENQETQEQHQESESENEDDGDGDGDGDDDSSEEDEWDEDGVWRGLDDEKDDDIVFKLSNFLAENGSMSTTLMDLDSLDCSICCNPLTIPVFQCGNGHTACSSCSSKLGHKCPSCSLPIDDNRCRAIEKVLESVRIPCENMRYGCGEIVTYNKKYNHDNSCIYAPCSCPIKGCNFISSSKKLAPHLRHRHVGDFVGFQYGEAFLLPLIAGKDYIALHEVKDGAIFIAHHGEEVYGNMITISCLGPPSSTGEFFYTLSTRSEGRSFLFQSHTKSIQSTADKPPSVGLILPPVQFFGTDEMIYLDLMIRRKDFCPSNIQSSANAV